MVELADTLDLGSSGRPWGFKSLQAHQKQTCSCLFFIVYKKMRERKYDLSMIYRKFKGKDISLLGFGAMRLPVMDGKDSEIDEVAAQELVDVAIKNGINYFDTAWGYHEGNSEIFMGKALKNYPRESFYLATKFPGYDISSFGRHEEIFERQLEKCQVDYFDFYLLHNVCEMNINEYLDNKKFGTFDYFMEQKRKGRIKHLGFSVHSNQETFELFLKQYGCDMEFCQIQLNYIDWEFQNAKAKVKTLNEYNIPIWVMEPMRGGKLANLPEEERAKLIALDSEKSLPEYAFKFLYSVDGVGVILSGMSDKKQLLDNIKIFENEKSLNEEERTKLLEIGAEMTEKTSVPCTSCHYCTAHCPKNLDIPYLLDLYNEHVFTKDFAFIAPMALQALDKDKRPDSCIGCRSCEKVCPQQIKISEVLTDFSNKLK